MINPAVSLYSSAKILDEMLLAALPGGLKDFDDWLNRMLGRIAINTTVGIGAHRRGHL